MLLRHKLIVKMETTHFSASTKFLSAFKIEVQDFQVLQQYHLSLKASSTKWAANQRKEMETPRFNLEHFELLMLF